MPFQDVTFHSRNACHTYFLHVTASDDVQEVIYDFGGSMNEEEEDEGEIDSDTDDDEDENDDKPENNYDPHDELLAAVEKTLNGLQKKERSLRGELEKAQQVEQVQHRANLLVSNLYQFSPGVTKVVIQDWETGEDIELSYDSSTYNSAQEESEALFDRARKLKRGSNVVQELLEKVALALEIVEDAKLDLESDREDEGRFIIVKERLERTSSQTGFQMPKIKSSGQKRSHRERKRSTRRENTFRKLRSPNGVPILVGRNRRDNDALSFRVARGDDLWMHARGRPGAHVVVQNRRGGPTPTEDCLQFAANLAAFYSDARTERKTSVTVAEPKHILKPQGAPLGAVKIRKELQSLIGRPQDVPEELKMARDESGEEEEAGKDKAKARKRQVTLSKQNQAKRRQEKRSKSKRRKRNLEAKQDFY